MYRQMKNICTCILLYISITCTNGLLCYSCYGKNNALDCEIITCELSSFDDLRTVCYYQVFESGYQRRGCKNVTSVLSQPNEGTITLYYCREDYCNRYSNVFLNGTRRQYKPRETLVPDLKPSWDSTVDEYSSLTGDNIQGDSTYNTIFLIIMIICITGAMICLYCCLTKSKCQKTSPSFLNTNIARHRSTDLEYCGNNSNYYPNVSYNIGSSNCNDYRDDPYSYSDINCGSVNDLGSGYNDDDGGDRGAGDCGGDDYGGGGDSGGGGCGGGDSGGGDCGGGGDSGGGDCGGGDSGGGDSGGGDCGGGDSGGGDCGGGGDSGGGDCGGGDSGGGDSGGGDCGGGDCGGGGDSGGGDWGGGGDSGGGDCGGGDCGGGDD